MEKRVLIATLLSLAFLFFWQYITYKPKQQVYEKPISSTEERKQELSKDIEDDFVPYVVETNFLKVVFNKKNAGIREVYVKEENSKDFTIFLKEKRDISFLEESYGCEVEDITDGNIKKVIFKSQNESLIFEFVNDENKVEENYIVKTKVQFKHPKKLKFSFRHYIHSDDFTKQEANVVHMAYSVKTDVEKKQVLVEKIKRINYTEKEFEWVAVSSRYFIFGILLGEIKNFGIFVNDYNKITKDLVLTSTEDRNFCEFRLLFSPKKISILEKIDRKLILTIEWGAFAPLSKLFYNILKFFYSIFHNYGLAIIFLTIILQIFTFPLTYNSIKAAAKMRQLQPQIQLLQKVYKDDPKRLNMEIMNLYKEKKVNPFGGCLPILLQIPIFWALFTMLRNTYDLRGAHFILWIKDLSQPDRLFIPWINFGVPVLVLFMGATMFLQQFISGGFSDPQQRSFSLMIPIIFIIMFINFPSGLVLYWFINNIFSISIQLIVNKAIKVK